MKEESNKASMNIKMGKETVPETGRRHEWSLEGIE